MAENLGEMIVYQSDDGLTHVNVRIDGETVWLTQAQMVELYRSSKANISEHISHILEEGELTEEATVRKFRTVQIEGGREVARDLTHYNLDMIIAVGYRVRTPVGTQFRQWATARLKEYMIKGFALDDERLKGTGGGNYWKELLQRIRDIRSSEKCCIVKCLICMQPAGIMMRITLNPFVFSRLSKINFTTRRMDIQPPR